MNVFATGILTKKCKQNNEVKKIINLPSFVLGNYDCTPIGFIQKLPVEKETLMLTENNELVNKL